MKFTHIEPLVQHYLEQMGVVSVAVPFDIEEEVVARYIGDVLLQNTDGEMNDQEIRARGVARAIYVERVKPNTVAAIAGGIDPSSAAPLLTIKDLVKNIHDRSTITVTASQLDELRQTIHDDSLLRSHDHTRLVSALNGVRNTLELLRQSGRQVIFDNIIKVLIVLGLVALTFVEAKAQPSPGSSGPGALACILLQNAAGANQYVACGGSLILKASTNITFTPITGGISISASGGGGTPGGAANSVQYNNAGAFGGFGSWNGTTLDLSTFVVRAAQFETDTANLATNGSIRFAKTDFIGWRNNANSANVLLSLDASDRIAATTFAGALVGNASTASALAANPTDCTTTGQMANAIAANGDLTCDWPNFIDKQDASGAITGTGADATVFSSTIPAIPAGKCIRATVWFLKTGGDTCVFKWKFGDGTPGVYAYGTTTVAASNSARTSAVVCNNSGVQNAQTITGDFLMLDASTRTAVAPVAITEDASVATTLSFTFNVAATSSVTPVRFLVEKVW